MSPGLRARARSAGSRRPTRRGWRLISSSTVPRSMPPSNDELIGSTRVISTPLHRLGSSSRSARLAIEIAHGQPEQRSSGVALRAVGGAGVGVVARVAALARRPLGQLHRDRLIAAVADARCSRAGEPGARAGDLPNQLVVVGDRADRRATTITS